MRNLTRLFCVFGLLLSVAFAGSLDETRKKAEVGDAEAQFDLGSVYANGDVVPKDYIEAAKWFRKAAEQGFANAQLFLGNMYENGDGVPKDYAQAVKWYRKAAEQGLANAQLFLGNMYGNGVRI
jgi:TPR repeat protein